MFGFRWQRRVEEELLRIEQLELKQLLVLLEIRNELKRTPATYPQPTSLSVRVN
jgi:hypothetical protein